jgi:hypothetical protein
MAAMHRFSLLGHVVTVVVASVALIVFAMPAAATSDPSGGCPRVASEGGTARPVGRLVSGRPQSVHLCRYGAEADPAGAAAGTFLGYGDVADRASTARIAGLMNRLPRTPRGIRSCPADDGSKIVATFRYRGGRQLTVILERFGCRVVHRGQIFRDGLRPPGGTLLRLLDSLVACAGGCHTAPGAPELR